MTLTVLILRVLAGIYGTLLLAQLVKMIFPNIDIPLGSEVLKERVYWLTLVTTISCIIIFFLLESGLASFITALNPSLSIDFLKDYEPEIGTAVEQIPALIRRFWDDTLSFFRDLYQSWRAVR